MVNKIVYKLAQAARKVGINFHEESDPRVQVMRKSIHDLGGIQFTIEVDKDGNWAAESTNIDGIITGGYNLQDAAAQIKDAIFTYFGIPPHLCKDALMRAEGEPVHLTKRVYA
ncbi:MAG: type II toxin-antitoxin system HicB family antitoxin [Candidatus Uhrbacteria bacterium]|nr:type II toxin-antitoxin system HicB family antitoxin [Candidatus Uhrbacteria bacterium]